MARTLPQSELKLLAYGAGTGLCYGLLVRVTLQKFPQSRFLAIMTVAFIFLLPFVTGFLSVFLVERGQRQPVWIWVVLPIFPLIGMLITSLLAFWEGMICIAMFTPVGLLLSIMGGLVGGLCARYISSPRAKNVSVACIMALPFLVGPWERKVLSHRELRQVESVIEIHATPEAVWSNIKRVPAIQPAELKPSWSRRIGFPSPVEATLSFEGMGGIRHASFESGVLFIETVDVWEPERRLAFSIHAETAQIPNTTLDEHVKVGGQFFDVLRGEYRLEELPNGITRLHLVSQERLTTDFNWYAVLWTDAIMSDLQNNILQVVRNRAETAFNRTVR
jgi:hypothetical protein